MLSSGVRPVTQSLNRATARWIRGHHGDGEPVDIVDKESFSSFVSLCANLR